MKIIALTLGFSSEDMLDPNFWEKLSNKKERSSSTCIGRANRRVKHLDNPVYNTCMMDTDQFLEKFDPSGTSVFSLYKISQFVEFYGDDANDFVFGYPEPTCGCFPGCHDFTVGKNHLTNFCCSDFDDVCVNPPSAKKAFNDARNEAENHVTSNFSGEKAKGPLRKLKRFSTKIERNIDDLTGDVNCEIGGIPAPIIHPKIANEFSDKLWHVYNHYFRDCAIARQHLNRLNRFANALERTERKNSDENSPFDG